MYKAQIQTNDFEIIPGTKTEVNGKLPAVRFNRLDDGTFQLTVNGLTKEADLVKIDTENKQVVLRMEGKKYTIQ